MSIIKLEVRLRGIPTAIRAFREDRKRALEAFSQEIRNVVSQGFDQLLNAEIDVFLGDPDQADNKRNGYFPAREYALKGIGCIRVKVPRDRKNRFESAIIPNKERLDPRVKAEIAMLHLAGLSSRTLAMMSKRVLGVEVSKDTVSESLEIIHEEASRWLERPIAGKYWALYVDGTNFKVQRRGSTKREPSLVVLGIDENNYRSILAIEPGTKDDCDAWRAVFAGLMRRGFASKHVRLGIMDGLPGLEKLFKEVFPNSTTQRCWVHSLRNALSKTPERVREAFKLHAHRIMYAESENQSRIAFNKLQEVLGGEADRALRCLEKDLDSLITFFKFDRPLWVALRTTNSIETINRQFKRRTRGMDSSGEKTLESVLVFTALKIEFGWQLHRIDSNVFKQHQLKEEKNIIEMAVEEIGLLN